MPYIAPLIVLGLALDRNVSFGNYPTTSSARRRCWPRSPPRLGLTAGSPPIAAGPCTIRQRPSRSWRHALSLFGDVKYPADFKHFDYVNPDAPKGGTVRQIAVGTFDNFNLVVAGVKGSLAAGVRADLRNPDDAVARRGLDRIRRCWPRRSAIPTISPSSPIGCAPRRNGMTASR